MGAIVGIDAKIEFSADEIAWNELPERNEFTINVGVDSAEHKIFVESLADAWADKFRTWLAWSGSINGYYDDADDTIFDTVVAGSPVFMRFFDSRNTDTKMWTGKALLTSVEHSVTTDDYATLSVEFEGIGKLERVAVPV